MRAMVYRGPYRIRVEDKDIPVIEHPNDAVVRVTRAAICGSAFGSLTAGVERLPLMRRGERPETHRE